MAASIVKFRSTANFHIFLRSRLTFALRAKDFSTHNLPIYSTGRKLPYVAFLIGFGLAGFVGFSGLFHGRRKQKKFDAASIKTKENNGIGFLSSNSSSNKDHLSETKTSHPHPWTLHSAIEESRSIIKCMKEETGSPGITVAVAMDGKLVWSEGFGFADLENRVLCSVNTVMRIASISKPLVATAVAKLWEENKLDLDAPIQSYVPSFPEKTFNGFTVTLTTRHLLSHLGGIRHYEKLQCNEETPKPQVDKNTENSKQEMNPGSNNSASHNTTDDKTSSNYRTKGDSEFYIKDHYKTLTEALSLFRDDPLLSKPGTSYLYTTHGWTILGAVVESVAKQDFLLYMKKLFKDLGMDNTCAEFNDNIIPHRARFYQRDQKGRLVNAPYVDNSYKFAGGGFMSTAEDLVQFGNAMLYAKQIGSSDMNSNETSETAVPREVPSPTDHLPGILRPETVAELWKIAANTEGEGHKDSGYGLGWAVIPEKQEFGACRHQNETVLHGGAAVGASSILLIRPRGFSYTSHAHEPSRDVPPQGVVVVVLSNLQEVHLQKTALAVASRFEKTKLKSFSDSL